MKRTVCLAILLATCLLAWTQGTPAQGVSAVRKQVEASMLVQGEITVDEHGAIAAYTLNDPDKLPQGVEAFVRKSVSNWSFDPPIVDGKPVRLRNDMSLLLVAKKVADDSFIMRVQAASFYPKSTRDGYAISNTNLEPPRYPTTAMREGVQGTVYLIVKVGRDGRVQDVMAEQVNLRVVASGSMMSKFRTMLADASTDAAKAWQFTPPTRGAGSDAEFWSVRVPVDFFMGGPQPKYGHWVAYIPGPREKASWLNEDVAEGSPEAMIAGQPRQLGSDELRLRTPLAGDS